MIRCRFNARGRQKYRRIEDGIVVGRHWRPYHVKVLWFGRRQPLIYHRRYLEIDAKRVLIGPVPEEDDDDLV